MSEVNLGERWLLAGSVFTPGSPVSERDLFAGRQAQITRIMEAVSQKGFHAVLYGDDHRLRPSQVAPERPRLTGERRRGHR
jgi:hypothetical protein